MNRLQPLNSDDDGFVFIGLDLLSTSKIDAMGQVE